MKHVIFILLISWNAVAAQSNGYAGYIRLGAMRLNDSRTTMEKFAPGYRGFKDNFYGIGGEFELKMERYILDGEITLLSHGPVNADSNYAEPFVGAITGKFGYTVFEKGRVTIYPSVGGGVSTLLVNTYTKVTGKKQAFHTTYLVQPTFDIGINANWIVYYFRSTTPTGILPIGIRAGYRFSVTTDNWKRIDGTNLRPVAFSADGYYLSLALGMGYITGKK